MAQNNLSIRFLKGNKMNLSNPKAVVITPATGSKELVNAIDSIDRQTYKDLLHLIVVDGDCYLEDTLKILRETKASSYKLVSLPFNTGNNGFNGHRIYASIPYILNCKYVFLLDEDNWYDDNHIESLINLIEENDLDWAYSFRKIYSHDKKFITDDNCESLGDYPSYSARINLVDTSCYAIKAEVLKRICHIWYHPLGADRIFFDALSTHFKKYAASKLYTLNYRLHSNRPPLDNFFYQGNQAMLVKYNGYPWQK